MTVAYIDTSFFLAIVFDEPDASTLVRVRKNFNQVFAADLLVAEALAAAARGGIDPTAVLAGIRSISLFFPPRLLEPEIGHTLALGTLRGADVWHLAAALFVAGLAQAKIAFLSRDRSQRTIARRLGFATP
jgi:predicted nucleic acid-binding protein